MRRMLNTLFVTTEDAYMALENENVIVFQDEKTLGKVPLITLENSLYFGYKGASPALMGACAGLEKGLCFFTPNGKFLARVCGLSRGNVLLRKRQYEISSDVDVSGKLASNFICGKIYNSRTMVERMRRDHPLVIDDERFASVSAELKHAVMAVRREKDLERIRGIEGNAAQVYFSIFDKFVLRDREAFLFAGRQKRPPIGRMNALLSFIYTILAHDCAYALEGVGLDAYVGFLHRDRPGRQSLALDLMEELRSVYADRFALTLINNRLIKAEDFQEKENGVTLLNDVGRKKLLQEWQKRKRDTITHPFLGEKINWGLVPYAQALLLARHIRGDLEEYPTFLWK